MDRPGRECRIDVDSTLRRGGRARWLDVQEGWICGVVSLKRTQACSSLTPMIRSYTPGGGQGGLGRVEGGLGYRLGRRGEIGWVAQAGLLLGGDAALRPSRARGLGQNRGSGTHGCGEFAECVL